MVRIWVNWFTWQSKLELIFYMYYSDIVNSRV
jgi:hypothetical protein